MWSRNKANLYIRDALDDFHYDPKSLISPPVQHKLYKQRLMLTHLVGFGAGVSVAAGGDVTSYSFDSAGDYLSIANHADFDFPNGGNFTIEFWIRVADNTPALDEHLYSMFVDGNNNHRVTITSGGGFNWVIRESSAYVVAIISSTPVLTNDVWSHFALQRITDDYYIFIDGVDKVASGSPDATTPVAINAEIRISGANDGSQFFTSGRLDEYRISDVARHSSGGFTPPTEQFTSDANTLFLMHCGETIVSGTTGSGATFVDSGNTGHTVTEGGDAIRDAVIYKF